MTALFSITTVETLNLSTISGVPFVYAINELNNWNGAWLAPLNQSKCLTFLL